jgi:hypothetical protein
MNPGIPALGALALFGGAVALVWRHRRSRDRMYARLAGAYAAARANLAFDAAERPHDARQYAATFASERLVCVEEFVAPATLARLRDEALAGIPRMEHSHVLWHKKGNTLSYEQILRNAPHVAEFYYNRGVQNWLSAVTGTAVRTTPVQDQSSLSILCYKEPGDHIQWHYDHNFYRGRHFTVLLSLVNRAAAGGRSHSRLERQFPDGKTQVIDMPENTLVVFEGSRVRHRATPTSLGDLRVILSMTYCDDPRISYIKALARRFKDTAFFGLRALWD